VAFTETKEFDMTLSRAIGSGLYTTLYLPLVKFSNDEPDDAAFTFVKFIRDRFPQLVIKDLMPHLRALRLIKAPCEIDAMRIATSINREGILAMMRGTKPGIMEYHLKAEYDYALMTRGVLAPASQPIISSGSNNFLIHYNSYGSELHSDDLILVDVGAKYDNIMTDVSRCWPVSGRFSEKQRLLYQCAVDTSEYMFSIIRPGMPMRDIDGTIKKYNFERLRDIGLCETIEEIGKYMWHGGSHHVGYDVHDVVGIKPDDPIKPGMVFCVDIGIYNEDWGIGFRLEDNCLVTETGCENLSINIPYKIDDIEEFLKGN
jgi:Xaa-Pro aminopeptidase